MSTETETRRQMMVETARKYRHAITPDGFKEADFWADFALLQQREDLGRVAFSLKEIRDSGSHKTRCGELVHSQLCQIDTYIEKLEKEAQDD